MGVTAHAKAWRPEGMRMVEWGSGGMGNGG